MSSRKASQAATKSLTNSTVIEALKEPLPDLQSGHASRSRPVRCIVGFIAAILLWGATQSTDHLSAFLDTITSNDGAEEAGNGIALFIVFLVALMMIVAIAKLFCNADNRDYSKFDTIVAEVADQLHKESQDLTMGGGETLSESPLLQEQQQSPPTSGVYHLEDRTFGISHKKSGDILLEGTSASSVVRLNLTFLESALGSSIEGSRTWSSSSDTHCSNNYVIQQGFVSAISRRTYWEESNQEGLRRVVTGQFDNDFTSFTGEWLASDGSRGSLRKVCDSLSVDYGIPLDEPSYYEAALTFTGKVPE